MRLKARTSQVENCNLAIALIPNQNFGDLMMKKMKSKRLAISLNTSRKLYSVPSHIALFLFMGFIGSCNSEQAEEKYSLLGSGYGINSSTLLVHDLEKTRDYFADVLGFDMPLPKDFTKGTLDSSIIASIHFPDMSYLELLSINDSTRADTNHSFITSFLEHYEGVRMYSLSSSSTDTTYQWLISKGFNIDSVKSYRTSAEIPKGWNWDDGGPQRRSLDFENRNPPAHLPRFVEDVNAEYREIQKEWKTYYSYGRRFFEHPNGVVGTAAIRIAVEDLDAARKEFKKIGFTELEGNDSKNLVRFKLVRNQELHVLTPTSADDDISKFLTTRGQGVFALRFEVKNLKATHDFLKERLPAEALFIETSPERLTVLSEFANGVQLEFVEEPEDQATFVHVSKRGEKLDSTAHIQAATMYAKYCVLCHGENREGYAADFAPSLRSHSLMATTQSSNFLRYTVHYGREGTAMAGYLKDQGGPMEYAEIEVLLQWLFESSGVEKPIELPRETVIGNVKLGSAIYAKNCAACHGQKGEGISAPALGNPMLLATATDGFLRHAIAEGRDNTPMQAFKDNLNKDEIDAVTAFLRSRASGWDVPKKDTVSIPKPENYVLNPNSKVPKFVLREGRYVSAKQLIKALQDRLRIVVLDARSEVAWRQTHIPGSIPVPYYEEPENFVKDLPNDSTWIVAYCACPHAASDKVISTLKRHGFKNTAILDEGILVWAKLGYPVQNGNSVAPLQ